MQASAAALDAYAFAPPPEPAAVRGFVLAVIAHLLLVVALSLGINWDKDTPPASVEAELWSALPQEAAPPPQPELPVVQAPPLVQAPPPPVTQEPDIAIEREKKRKEQEAKQETRRREEEAQRKLEAQKRKLDEDRRLAQEKQLRDEQAKKEQQQKERESKLRDQARKEQMARMQALASGGGAPTSQGVAQKSSGSSDSYAGRIRARVKPNIVFTEDIAGNPSAEVEVRMAPDGTIVSRKITKSSGVQVWDDAVLRALDKTEILPRDVDGRVHTPLTIIFTPRG